jgi:predicted acylesterase/phospholipase RssA
MAANTAAHLELWRREPARPPLLYVRPELERNATFRVERVEAYAEAGYRAALVALAEWQRS